MRYLVTQYPGSNHPPEHGSVWLGESRRFSGNKETLADLYADTGEKRYLNLSRRFHDVTHSIPKALTQGKDKVTVRFQAHPGGWAACSASGPSSGKRRDRNWKMKGNECGVSGIRASPEFARNSASPEFGIPFLRMHNKAAAYAVNSGTYRLQSTLPEAIKGTIKGNTEGESP